MKVSHDDWFAHHTRILLDGEEPRGVISADDEAGEVLLYPYDAQGRPKVNEAGDALVTEVRRGAVKIEWIGPEKFREAAGFSR